MEEFIQGISTQLGVSEDSVRRALRVLLDFAQKKLDPSSFQSLIDRIPGAAELMARLPAPSGGGGGLGALLGGQMAEAFKAYSDLQAAGLSSAQVVPFLQAFFDEARKVAGPETVDAILQKVPVLQNLLNPKS